MGNAPPLPGGSIRALPKQIATGHEVAGNGIARTPNIQLRIAHRQRATDLARLAPCQLGVVAAHLACGAAIGFIVVIGLLAPPAINRLLKITDQLAVVGSVGQAHAATVGHGQIFTAVLPWPTGDVLPLGIAAVLHPASGYGACGKSSKWRIPLQRQQRPLKAGAMLIDLLQDLRHHRRG